MATMDDTIYTTDDIFYVNQTYSSPIVSAVFKIATNQTLTTNLQFFLNASSAASNQTWGGIKRADIYTSYGSVASSDALQWLKIFTSGSTPDSVDAYPNSRLVIDELFASWLTQGIGYYGDTTSEPLFLPANTKTTDITVGTASLNGITYYGHDSGPTLFYGSIQSRVFTGADGKEYAIHACRWTGGNSAVSVYLRLDHPDILETDGYATYETAIFFSLTIGSLTLNSSAITGGFTVDGGVGFYWENISTNPFASVGSKTTISLAGILEGPFGLEVYNPLGNALITITSDIAAFVAYDDTITLNSGESITIPIAGMTNTPQWEVFIPGFIAASLDVTKSTGSFTLTNNFTGTIDVSYWVVRLG